MYAFGLVAFVSTAQINEVIPSSTTSLNLDAEKLIEVSGKYFQDKIYFQVLIKNESSTTMYSLVKEHLDGSIESVDYKMGVKNNINTPLLYCLKEEDAPDTDCRYLLYRFSDKIELLKTWSFYSSEQKLYDVPLKVLSVVD